MKVLKIVGGLVLGVLVLMLIGSFFISSNFRASDTQTLKASPEAVYQELITTGNWKNWSYWMLQDPESKVTYNEISSGVGASYSWKSEDKKMGSGTMTVAGVEPNHYVNVSLDFGENGNGFGEYIINPAPNGGSEVTSSFNSESKNPLKKWMSRLVGKPMMKTAFRESMTNLDKYIAEHPAPAPATLAAPAEAEEDTTKGVKQPG